MTNPSVRERVKVIQLELRRGALPPDTVRESLITLTSLLGNVNQECVDADVAYKTVLLAAFQSEETANRAKIRAEISPEYRRAREAQNCRELVLEMIRSCRAYIRSLDEEMRLAK